MTQPRCASGPDIGRQSSYSPDREGQSARAQSHSEEHQPAAVTLAGGSGSDTCPVDVHQAQGEKIFTGWRMEIGGGGGNDGLVKKGHNFVCFCWIKARLSHYHFCGAMGCRIEGRGQWSWEKWMSLG